MTRHDRLLRFTKICGGFRTGLLSLGYTTGTMANQLAVVGRFGRWLAVQGRTVDQLGLADIDAFIADQGREC